ncbi:hypothetical protein [Staphylococcus chromogenes]|uniref:hypothetical protein n=1 Tax=Staphylococcus chromogenes TaxID=46126 RepID=UPI0034DB205D
MRHHRGICIGDKMIYKNLHNENRQLSYRNDSDTYVRYNSHSVAVQFFQGNNDIGFLVEIDIDS